MASIRVVNSPLLLTAIFKYLEPPISTPIRQLSDVEKGVQKELRYTLLCSALVSRSFSRHALAVLWQQLDDVQPLLRLFAQFRPSHRGSQVSMLHEDIAPEAWLRFQAYASCVRILHQGTWSQIHSSTWSVIYPWCGRRPLLPKLEALSTLPVHVSDPVMMMFLTPTLHSLRVETFFGRQVRAEDFTAITCIIHRISKTAPEVTDLHIIHDGYNPLPPTYLHPLCNFAALRIFEAENAVLGLPILQWLAKLDGLQTLSASIALEDVESDDLADGLKLFDHTDWSALIRLSIHGESWNLRTFVSQMCHPPLRSLTLDVSVECWPEDLTNLVTYTLESFDDPLRIEEFTLKYKHEFKRQEEHQAFMEEPHYKGSLLDIVGYLLHCSSIKKAVFDLSELPALTDVDLERMIDAWPQLTVLHIPPSETNIFHVHVSKKIPRPTMASLTTFARRCPQLQELSLPEIRLSTIPRDQDWPYITHPLCSLLAGFDCRKDDCLRVAKFIDGLFPSVSFHEPAKEDRWSLSLPNRDEHPESVKEYLETVQLGRRRRDLLKKVPRTDLRAGQATAALW